MSDSCEAKKSEFASFLRTRGLRFTKEREAVFEEAIRARGHFNPEGLRIRMANKGQKASLASIYRTIPLMLESGMIEEAAKTDKQAQYESTAGRGHHDHMLCIRCGTVIEFYSVALERLQERLCLERGFSGVSHSLAIRGYCRKCGARKNGS